MSLSIMAKFHEDEMKTVSLIERTSLIWYNFGQFKGHHSEMLGAIELVINLGRDSMPLRIVTKFHEDLIKAV